MKIAIDNVIFQLQENHPRGIFRVWNSILPYMKDMLVNNEMILLCRQGTDVRKNFGFKTYSISRYENQLQDEDAKMLSSVCKKLGVDLFITTYNTRALGIKSMVMVYDMVPEKRSWVRGCNEFVARSKAYLNADILVCISENTKRDLCKWYDTSSKRVEVVLLGVSAAEFHPLVSRENSGFMLKYGLNPGYMVLDGAITKEVAEVFCRAFSSLDTDISLFWYGGALKEYMVTSCEKHGVPHLKVGHLEDREVPLALSGAEGLIFISGDEGFGLPVLEAMACGIPVLCSNVDSLPEVGGDTVQYFADHSSKCMKESLARFLLDDEYRKFMGERGFVRSQQFSWKKTAEEIVQVISSTILSLRKSSDRRFLTPELCNYLDFFVIKALKTSNIDIRNHLITLFSIAISLGAKNILEIGVRRGYSTLALNCAVGLTKGKLTSVDIVKPKLKLQLPFPKNWTFVQSDSLVFLRNLKSNEKFDIVFIDGNHTYSQVKQELKLIAVHVDERSLILLHDTMPHSCPLYGTGVGLNGFQGGGPYTAISELDKNGWEYSTLPVSNGLTILRKIR